MNTASEFVALRTSENPSDYHRASHEEAPDDVWFEILRLYPEMAMWVAHNKTIPPCVMEKLVDSEDVAARHMLAMRRSCPPHLLRRLANDKHETVRNAVALNKKTPLDVLQLLASDEWETCARNAGNRLRGES